MLHNFHFDVHLLPYKTCTLNVLIRILGALSSIIHPAGPVLRGFPLTPLSSQIKR